MKRAVVFVVLVGCFSKPDFMPSDATAVCALNTTAGLTVEGRRVTWPPLSAFSVNGGMTIELGDPDTMVPMPTDLSVKGTNLIADPEGCGYEDRVGMSIYPMFAARSVEQVGFPSTLTALVSGPAFTQFETTWGHRYMCGPIESTATGSSTFSMFPDGRIVRVDTITPSSVDLDQVDCIQRCQPAADFYVTSHTAFEVSKLAGAAAGATLDDSMVPAVGPGVDAGDGGCVQDLNDGRIALRWDRRVNTPAMSTRFRSLDNGGHRQVAFVADLEVAPSMAGGASHGIRTTMILNDRNDSCAQLQARAEDVATLPDILINGESVSASEDQVYRANRAYDGPITVSTATDVPDGFVLAVELPGTMITTNRDPADVIWHRAADGRFYIHFRTFLNNGPERAITITPC